MIMALIILPAYLSVTVATQGGFQDGSVEGQHDHLGDHDNTQMTWPEVAFS